MFNSDAKLDYFSVMERIVIVAYKPKPGHEEALKRLVVSHLPRLRKEGLVTDRDPVLAEAGDGTLIEIFGWKSKEAIEKAHENPEVQKMWAEFDEVSDYIPLANIEEAQNIFSEFGPMK